MALTISTAILPLIGRGALGVATTDMGGCTPLSEAVAELRAAGIERTVAVLPMGARIPMSLALAPGLRVIRAEAPRGTGAAVLAARDEVGRGPVAVLLAEDLILGGACLAQMVDAYHRAGTGHLVATREVAPHETSLYGIVDPLTLVGAGPVFRTVGIVEAPGPRDAPSRIAVAGRYILHPQIFADLSARARRSAEPCLTGAISDGMRRVGLSGTPVAGERHDCRRPEGRAAALASLGAARLIAAAE